MNDPDSHMKSLDLLHTDGVGGVVGPERDLGQGLVGERTRHDCKSDQRSVRLLTGPLRSSRLSHQTYTEPSMDQHGFVSVTPDNTSYSRRVSGGLWKLNQNNNSVSCYSREITQATAYVRIPS